MTKVRYNKSKTYLLPLLSEVVEFDLKYYSYLKNTFIFDKDDIYKDCIFILHDFSFKNPEFTLYEHKLIDNPYFVDLIDISNTEVLYIYKFPEEYLHEYNQFKKGNYSKFGIDAKELILEFWTAIYNNNVNAVSFLVKIKQILFKDKKLKKKIEEELSSKNHKVIISDDAELTDPINEEYETFDIKEYIKDNDVVMNKMKKD